MIFAILKAISIKMLHELIVAIIWSRIQTIAVRKIIEDLEIWNLFKQGSVLLRIERNILDKLSIDRAIAAINDSGLLDRVDIDIQLSCCQLSQVKAIYKQSFPYRIQYFVTRLSLFRYSILSHFPS